MIENTPFEEDLTESLEQAMNEYPDTCAVLVRRHGVYVRLLTITSTFGISKLIDF